MKVLDQRENGSPRTVELTDEESKAHDVFHSLLDGGLPTPLCAKLALNRFPSTITVDFTFGAWLSEGTCTRRAGRAVIRPEWR